VNNVAFSPESERVATGELNGMLRVWDLGTGRELARMQGQGSALGTIAFSPDGLRLVAWTWDGTALVWNVHAGDWEDELRGKEVLCAMSPLCGVAWWTRTREAELSLVRTATGEPAAWLPEALHRLTPNAGGGLWAGTVGGRLRLYRLEGHVD
jgi:hypothetical protein